jgi:hypothetical protein
VKTELMNIVSQFSSVPEKDSHGGWPVCMGLKGSRKNSVLARAKGT